MQYLVFKREYVPDEFYKYLGVGDMYGVISGGSRISQGWAPTYHLTNFSRKLHENEEILGQGGARVPRPHPLIRHCFKGV